jgi:hypothetical protein
LLLQEIMGKIPVHKLKLLSLTLTLACVFISVAGMWEHKIWLLLLDDIFDDIDSGEVATTTTTTSSSSVARTEGPKTLDSRPPQEVGTLETAVDAAEASLCSSAAQVPGRRVENLEQGRQTIGERKEQQERNDKKLRKWVEPDNRSWHKLMEESLPQYGSSCKQQRLMNRPGV